MNKVISIILIVTFLFSQAEPCYALRARAAGESSAESEVAEALAGGAAASAVARNKGRSSSDTRILAAIERLKAKTPPVAITQETIAQEAGVVPVTVTRRKQANPEIAAAIEDAYLSESDADILAAIERLKAKTPPVAITRETIAQEAGVVPVTVTNRKQANPEIAAAIDAAIPSVDKRILAAIERLKAKTPPVAITQETIAQEAGVDVSTVTNRKQANPEIASAIEAAIPSSDSRILAAIERLKAKTPPVAITRETIAQEAGVDVSTVTNRKQANPEIAAAIDAAKSAAGAAGLRLKAAERVALVVDPDTGRRDEVIQMLEGFGFASAIGVGSVKEAKAYVEAADLVINNTGTPNEDVQQLLGLANAGGIIQLGGDLSAEERKARIAEWLGTQA